MPKVGRFIHEVVNGTDVAINNAFGLGKQSDISSGSSFSGFLEGVIVRLKSVGGGAAKVTVKICHNTNGTGVVIPDTEAEIAFEVGSAVAGAIAIKIDFAHVHTDGSFSLFYKTNAGTATVDQLELYWSE